MPDDVIYNDTGRAYHNLKPLRTMAHIRGSHADNTLMTRLQQEVQTTLYYSALEPSLLAVHLPKRWAQLLPQQLPLPDRVARWYGRKGFDIPPEYIVCQCHLQTPETLDHFRKCRLAQDGVHLATWKPGDTITQHAGWGPATLLANEVRRLMRKPEIKGAVLWGAVPLELYRVLADNAPDTRATVSHMLLKAIKPADAQLQYSVQLYTQGVQHALDDQRTYYNVLIHYQSVQPMD